MIAKLIRAVTKETKAFRDENFPHGSVYFIFKGLKNKPQTYTTPSVIISIESQEKPSVFIGGANMYFYSFSFAFMNEFNNNGLDDDDNADFELLEIIESLVNHFSVKGWLTQEMKDVAFEDNFNIVFETIQPFDGYHDETGKMVNGFMVKMNTSSIDARSQLMRMSFDDIQDIVIELEGYEQPKQPSTGIVENDDSAIGDGDVL